MNLTNDVKKSWALLREGFLSEVRASQDTEYIHAFYIIDRAIKEEMTYGEQLEQKKIDVFPESPFGRLGGD